MKKRKFKYSRKYINGSKKNEIELFNQVKKDNPFNECDWLEYARLIPIKFKNLLFVIYSWKILTFRLSIFSMIISIILMFISVFLFKSLIGIKIITLYASFILSPISIIFMIIYLMLDEYQKRTDKCFESEMDIIFHEMFK